MMLDALAAFTDTVLLLAQQTSSDAPGWLERFMGLSQLRLGDADTVLGWRWALPAWLWVLVFLAAAGVGMMSYRHLVGARMWRVALGALRAITVIVIVALLAGPMLVLPRERVQRDWLIMLVDRSASLQIRDMPPPEVFSGEAGAQGSSTQPATQPALSISDDANLSRDEVLADVLRRRQDLFGPDQLGGQKHVLWLGFDRSVFPIGGPGALGQANGQATAIRSAIQQALQRAAGQPISAMVLITDGRSSEATTGQLIHELGRQAVSVIAVPLGSEEGKLDLAIRQVTAPDRAFIDDPVPVSVQVDRFPADAPLLPGQVTLRLTDAATGEVLDEKQPTIEALDGPITLTGESGRAGPGQWRVQVIYQPPMQSSDASSPPPRELLVENNLRDFEIELVDRQLRVLYVEGYPRWDYRYIKNMLLREKSVLSSVLILSADPGFVQEGTLPITRFPSTMAELEPYDVLIVGDVPAGYFSAAQLQMIQDHVATTGAGLLWIGGPRDTPVSYQGTPLADLLPMLSPAQVSRVDVRLSPVRLSPAPLAQALQVLELNPESASGAQTLWQETLAPLWYMQDVGPLKPTAELLAMASPSSQESASADDIIPAMLRLRFGAGQSVYVATDETWRYRFGRGEIYFERFWTQLIRMLARGRLAQDQGSITLTTSTRRAQLDEPVVVTAQVKDDALAQLLSGRLKVEVTTAPEAPDAPDTALVNDGGVLETIELQPLPADDADRHAGRRYQATWRPGSTGRLTLRLADASLAQMGISRAIEVIRPDDELQQPLPDFARLEALAAQTQGHVLSLEDLRKLPTLLPNRAQRTPDDLREPLWNSALALTLVILLLTMEWIGRKLIRLA